MRAVLPSLVLLAMMSPAAAAPAADVVLVWAPPAANVGPITLAAQRAGAAVLDRSPTAPVATAADAAAPLVARGIEAYDALRFDDARVAFDRARDAVDRTGAADLTTAQLADLWLYRGLVRAQAGDTTAAWDELVASAIVAPDRVLDPARFPPRVIEQLERARAAVAARPRAELVIDAPAGCVAVVDGAALAPHAQLAAGAHWIHVTCAERAPWGGRVDVAAPSTTITPTPVAYAPLTDADALIQARTLGAHAFVVAEVHGELATARRIGVDGHEQDRRTVTLPADGDLAPLAAAVADLLARTASETPVRWYDKKWVWAAAAAAIAAAILVPLTAELVHDDRAATATVRINGSLWQ